MLNIEELITSLKTELQKNRDILHYQEIYSNLYASAFDGFISDAENTGHQDFANRASRTKKSLNTALEDRPIIKSVEKTLRDQSLVATVTNMEVFLKGLFVYSVGNYPKIVLSIDKYSKGMKIPIHKIKEIIDNPSDPHIGEIILSCDDSIKFQDLNSTLRTFQNCLDIVFLDQEINNTKDEIILAHGLRHVIVHNRGIIDEAFKKQIHGTKYQNLFQLGDTIDLDDEMVLKLIDSISEFSEKLVNKVKDKYEPD